MRIVSVDGLDIGRAPGGELPRDVIWPQLAARRLGDMVIYAPEDDVAPWERTSRLVLVDGRHDYAGVRDDVEYYSPRLAPGGYQLFHDYADYFPDVPRYVNELLMDPEFEFVVHVRNPDRIRAARWVTRLTRGRESACQMARARSPANCTDLDVLGRSNTNIHCPMLQDRFRPQ